MKKIFNAFLVTSLLSSSLCLADENQDIDPLKDGMEYTADAHRVFTLKRKFDEAQSKPYPVKKYQMRKLSKERNNLSITLRNKNLKGTRANFSLLRNELSALKK